MISRIKKRHIALVSFLALFMIAGIFYLQGDALKDTSTIRPYDHSIDFIALSNLINANQFWLSESSDLDPKELLTWRAPHHDPSRKGQARFAVIEDEGRIGGFITYYKENFQQGFIWLLAVHSDFRGRGFGSKLMQHALENLKAQGAQYVTINVRLINKPAMALYKKFGFIEKSRNENRGMTKLILPQL